MKTTPGLEFKFLKGGAALEGYAARFGERDLGGDIIQPGAFAKTIADVATSGYRLPMLWAHSQEDVVGSWGELREDASGLWASGTINRSVERGKEALSLVKGGDLSGLSIGYMVPAGGRSLRENSWHLTEIKLLEISLVAVPMAPRARIALKEMDGVEGFAAVLRSAGVSRRDAEFVARKSWPAITSEQSEIDLDQVAARLAAHASDRKSWR